MEARASVFFLEGLEADSVTPLEKLAECEVGRRASPRRAVAAAAAAATAALTSLLLKTPGEHDRRWLDLGIDRMVLCVY